MVEVHPWNEKLDLDHEAMDHEHHLQIALVSALVEAVEQRRPWMARRLGEQLLAYSLAHFGGEELLMEQAGYAESEAHAAQHEAFVAHIREVQRALGDGDDEVAVEAAIDLRQGFADHVNGPDRRLAAMVRGRH